MIEIVSEAGVPYVALKGEFDLSNVADLDGALAAYADGLRIVVDLTAVTFLDSTVLHVLLRLHERSHGKLLVILPPHSRIRRVFEVTKLLEYLRIVPDRQAAAGDDALSSP